MSGALREIGSRAISSRRGAGVVVAPPGARDSVHGVPVPSFLLRVLRRCVRSRGVSPRTCVLAKGGVGFHRPQSVRCCFGGALGGYRVRPLRFRYLQRAFTAHYMRLKFSVGALDRVLKRSGVGAALGQCIRPSVRRGRRGVSGLGTMFAIGWLIVSFGGPVGSAWFRFFMRLCALQVFFVRGFPCAWGRPWCLPRCRYVIRVLGLFLYSCCFLFLCCDFCSHLEVRFCLPRSSLFLLIRAGYCRVTLVRVVTIRMVGRLFFSLSIVLLSVPGLRSSCVSFSGVICGRVYPTLVPYLDLGMMVAGSVGGQSRVRRRMFPTFFFGRFLVTVSMGVVGVGGGPFRSRVRIRIPVHRGLVFVWRKFVVGVFTLRFGK